MSKGVESAVVNVLVSKSLKFYCPSYRKCLLDIQKICCCFFSYFSMKTYFVGIH